MSEDEAQPSRRNLVHTREITCRVYQIDGGGYEVEGRLTDTKTHEAVLPFKTVPSGQHYHDMRIHMTIDAQLTIVTVKAHSQMAPTPYCGESNATYAALAGIVVGPGFKDKVKAVVGGRNGCTHMTDLLGPMATAAIQASLGSRQTRARLEEIAAPEGSMPRPWVVDTCHAYRLDGEAVNVIWPKNKRRFSEDAKG